MTTLVNVMAKRYLLQSLIPPISPLQRARVRMSSTATASTPLELVHVPPTKKAALDAGQATVIFMRGLGDPDASSRYYDDNWKMIASMIGRKREFAHVKWVLPLADVIPISGNGGFPMRGWFDIPSFSRDPTTDGFAGPEDESGMLTNVSRVTALIETEINTHNTPPERIVLAGFSQGGAMSLMTGLTVGKKLGGLAILSGWLPIQEKIKSMANDHAGSLPIFWGHGDADEIVPLKLGQRSKDFLTREVGVKEASASGEPGLSFNVYRGLPHSFDPGREMADFEKWLAKVLPAL